ncbi:MAG: homoserine O-succinyltransferase [Paracoccaceae bacterium]|nr:homoserine O-succinyltransferase [Paracoccaceae bacterium]
MPIKIPKNLPAYKALEDEGVMVLSEAAATRQDIRPLQIGLLNLMPTKIQTETQFARLIGATPLQIELTLIRMSEHHSKNTSPVHMEEFYQPVSKILSKKFDGLIITGAPIEHLPFKDVTYWMELCKVFEWTQTNVFATFGVCWGGMAMINYFHDINKHLLDKKKFGCFWQQNLEKNSPFLRGFSDECLIPISRWTEVKQDEIDRNIHLKTLLGSPDTGPCLVEDYKHRAIYIFNHFEYDSDTLKQEYERDKSNGVEARIPKNYFTGDNPELAPSNRWRSHAHLLYGNWINEIYQNTPYDISDIGS